MLTKKDFNFDAEKSTESDDSDVEDGQVPNFGKFESKKAKILKKNIANEARFKEPRMFTME